MPVILTLHHEPPLRSSAHARPWLISCADIDAGVLHPDVRDHQVPSSQHLDALYSDWTPICPKEAQNKDVRYLAIKKHGGS